MAKYDQAFRDRVQELGKTMGMSEIGRAMGVHPTSIKYVVDTYRIPVKRGAHSIPRTKGKATRVRHVGDVKLKEKPALPVFEVSTAMERLAQHDPVIMRAMRQKRGERVEAPDLRLNGFNPHTLHILHKKGGRSLNPSPQLPSGQERSPDEA